MDADEKLLALKKAYVDIVLSISKEAAARVMASERKSLRYQHELKLAKEEGVRMLLRLKQMIDSQISEAEAASLNQQMKIEELEAQLHEAEDIVKDLREELSEVQAELGRVKKENLQRVNEPANECLREIPVQSRIYSYQSREFLPENESYVASDIPLPYLNQRNEFCKCNNKIVCMCGAYVGHRDLPSIILRGKEPGQYRNGCTQRIIACERNLLNKDLCLSEDTDKIKNKKNGTEQEEDKDSSEGLSSGAKTLGEIENKQSEDVQFGSSQSFLHKGKRGSRRRKTVILKPDQLHGHSVTSEPISGKDLVHSDENPNGIGLRLSPDETELQIQLGCAESSEKGRNLVDISGGKTVCKDGVNDIAVTLSQEIEFPESFCSADCKTDVEKVEAPSEDLESNLSEATKELLSQPARGRVIKYTFQRKRKRQVLGESQLNGSIETEKKLVDGPNGDQKLEQPKQSLVMESSRDSRRLAQVARQLISLSEKKWWH